MNLVQLNSTDLHIHSLAMKQVTVKCEKNFVIK